ncbi:MAG: IclR family transcriptional regulator [Synergistaceae bacterium]|jgi:DNA-binding IclR family transcriptional regulator|nr:IclR family transcriptional regulator [Synergistaceae bacterium]
MARDDHSAVDRVADILEFVATQKGGATFSEIVRSLAIPKSSLHPLIHTLCKRRFVLYRENEQRYFLGDRIFSLGFQYGSATGLLGMISDALAELARSVEETCYFGVLAGNEVLYLLKQVASNPIQVTARPGYRLKAYASAIGKSLLSQFDRDELLRLYPDGLEPVTENTVTDMEELCRQLSKGREEGFLYEKEESSEHVQCVAAPVFYQQKVTAALSVAFPIFTEAVIPEKIQFNKEKLTLVRQKIEDIIARNRGEWVYGD